MARAEPATVGGTPLAPIETVDDVPVTEDGHAKASYTVSIANASITVPLDLVVTSEMRGPTAVTTVTQPLVVEGQVTQEQEVVRGPDGDIERTRTRAYPASLFAVNVDEPDTEDTEPEDPDKPDLPDAA